MRKILLSGVAVVVVFTLLPTPSAHASCAALPPLEQVYAEADVVFKGTVIATEGGDRIATVRVEQVWKGSALPETVEVRGGPRGENIATSVDRHFDVGATYLFFPGNRRTPFRDNICTATRPYRPALEALRESATEGGGSPLPFTGPDPLDVWVLAGWWLMSGGIALLTTAYLRRRERDVGARTP